MKYFNLNCHEIYFSASVAAKIETKLSWHQSLHPFASYWWFGNRALPTRQLRQIPEWSCRTGIRTHSSRSVSRPDGDNRNTSGMTSRKRSDTSMRRTEVYSPSLLVGLAGVWELPYPIYIDLEYPIYSTTTSSIFSTRSSRPFLYLLLSISDREIVRSIYLSRRGHHRNSEMTGRNDKAYARQDSSGSLIGKCVYTDGRTDDINASGIIAIGHLLALRVKFAVRRAVSDSETTCSLNCMRLHVARSLPKRCQRLACLLSQIPPPYSLWEIGYI